MKIYFAAHATTIDNESGKASGWNDVGLSELGLKQAEEMGKTFRNIKLDLICCSDLKRASDTVKIAFGDKIPVIKDKRLREINYGDFTGKSTKLVRPQKIKCVNKAFLGGESYMEAVARVQGFYKELIKNHPDKDILIVGHRATQYGLDIMINNKKIEELLSIPFKWQPYWKYKI